MMTDDYHGSHRGLSLIVTAAAMLAAAGIGVGVASMIWQPDEPWAPLGNYPTQSVLDRVDGVDGPAARLDADGSTAAPDRPA